MPHPGFEREPTIPFPKPKGTSIIYIYIYIYIYEGVVRK